MATISFYVEQKFLWQQLNIYKIKDQLSGFLTHYDVIAKFYTENYHVPRNLIGATGNISEIQCRHKCSEEIDPLGVQIFDNLWKVKSAKAVNDLIFLKRLVEERQKWNLEQSQLEKEKEKCQRHHEKSNNRPRRLYSFPIDLTE
uniref:Uncharacterized protein n=1 Tax=Romanomermis culicivorax TaxID=13658 RepID=A0A915IME8_ROMCU